MNQLALSLEEGRRRKREGMALTASVNSAWIEGALADLKVFAAHYAEFPLEQFRAWRSLRQQPEPTNHHAWGALTNAAQRAGIIKWTGRYTQASSVKTHAHVVRIWRAA